MTIYIPSFLNHFCFFLVIFAIFCLYIGGPRIRKVQEVDDLEVAYCKFPQTHSLMENDTKICSSVNSLFVLLKNGCSHHKEAPDMVAEMNDTVQEDDGRDTVMEEGTEDDKDKITSSLMDLCVMTLLLFTVSVTMIEWYKEWARGVKQELGESPPPGEGENLTAARNHRFSLADMTFNRHVRQQMTHHQVVRQSSVGAASVSGSKPTLVRRSSFPAQLPENRSRQAPQRQQSHPSRRVSVDLGEDDSPVDRRRVRIIRRH